jgi:type II secretory pathway pseudopilin PulG
MKLTPINKRKAGMTLLELTVVILVLLSLISILFIGARAWKKGSDRAASILQIRNVQQAVRSYANMNGINPGETPVMAEGKTLRGELFGEGKFITNDPEEGTHPAGAKFSYAINAEDVVPDIGTLYMTVEGATDDDDATDYIPTETGDW